MKTILATLIASMGIAHAAPDLLVDWGNPNQTGTGDWSRGGDLVTVTGDFNNNGIANDVHAYYAFDESTPLSPSSSSYLDNTTTSAVWYGGQEVISYDHEGGTNFYNQRIVSGHDGRRYIYNRFNNDGAINKINSVWVWQAADFLQGGAYTFDNSANSYMTMENNHENSTGSWFDYNEGRFVIKLDGQYYISEHNRTVDGLTLSGPASANWATYDPATNLGFDAGTATFGTLDFSGTSLEAVGVFASRDSGTTHVTGIDFFSVAAIPEPGTLVLMGIALGSLVLFRRRK
ncbi:MAG: PEP-CTERM sorting domain-containing protein [Verrucomicrobia bacterium]|nr:PEP-CTERM sorting domain-containing protein [Verrucomicrobiota bacterium]MCH8514618.1 PEP-CTERM sorting domain-containing protein [Kiritimatiellia bacterium]